MPIKQLTTKKAQKIFCVLYAASWLGIIILIIVNSLFELKANINVIEDAAAWLVMLNSVFLFGLVYSHKKSFLIAAIMALILPAIFFGYPSLTDHIDMYRAEHDPNSFYYKP